MITGKMAVRVQTVEVQKLQISLGDTVHSREHPHFGAIQSDTMWSQQLGTVRISKQIEMVLAASLRMMHTMAAGEQLPTIARDDADFVKDDRSIAVSRHIRIWWTLDDRASDPHTRGILCVCSIRISHLLVRSANVARTSYTLLFHAVSIAIDRSLPYGMKWTDHSPSVHIQWRSPRRTIWMECSSWGCCQQSHCTLGEGPHVG